MLNNNFVIKTSSANKEISKQKSIDFGLFYATI